MLEPSESNYHHYSPSLEAMFPSSVGKGRRLDTVVPDPADAMANSSPHPPDSASSEPVEEALAISYALTHNDLAEYWVHRSSSLIWAFSGITLLIGSICLGIGEWHHLESVVWGQGEWILLLPYFLGMGAITVSIMTVFLGIYPALMQLKAWYTIPKNSPALEARQVIVTPHGILGVKSLDNQIRPWSTIQGIEDGRTAIYLIMNRQKALVIPKHAFMSEAASEEFLEYVRRAWEKNQPTFTPEKSS